MMKKIYLVMLLCCMAALGYGQVTVLQTFSGTSIPGGWTTSASLPWTFVTTGVNPTCSPHSAGGMAEFNSYNSPYTSGTTGTLITPVIDWSSRASAPTTMTLWYYRDVDAYNDNSYDLEGITVYVNTSATVGGSNLGYVPRRGGRAISGGVTGTSTTGSSGWFQYTFTIPTTYNSATNYIIIYAYCQYGDNLFVDDVQYNLYPPVCGGTPTAGTVSPSATSGCSTYTSVLSLTGATSATGITYQWQSSPDNLTYTNVSGATNSNYSATVTANIYYRCTLRCTGSGLSATTAGVLLSYSSCIIMTNGSSSVCNAAFYDAGGAGANYNNYEDYTYTIYPGAAGSKVSVTFNSFALETCCDWMEIYNGNSTGATQIGHYISSPGVITSTAADGSLTFKWHTDVSGTYSGWDAAVTNIHPNPITAQPPATTNACQTTPLTIGVTATGTVNYQWYNNGSTNANSGGSLIAGATNATYSPSTASLSDNYFYCVVTNACGVVFPSNTARVIVNTLPAGITGTARVCPLLNTTLADGTPGGNWSSSITTAGTVGATTGVVTGIAAGTTTISYTMPSSGCSATKVVTIDPLPNAITGTPSACVTAATTLSSGPAGGGWGSSNTSIAVVNSTGVVVGAAAGLATITYTGPNTCYQTLVVSINPNPSLNVTPATTANVCIGSSATFTATATLPNFSLMSQDFNSGLGSWTTANTSGGATSIWQVVNAGYDGTAGDGSKMMQAAGANGAVNTRLNSPSFSTVGYGAVSLSFNQYMLSDGTDTRIAVEYSVDGGTVWSDVVNQTSSGIIGTGVWSASTPETTIPLPPNAINKPDVRLRWNYIGSSFHWFIDNVNVSASLPTPTYTWAGVSGAIGLSCVACSTPTITPGATGVNMYNVTATSSSGCSSSRSVGVTANPLPGSFSVSGNICIGVTVLMSNTLGGGTWSTASSNVSLSTTGDIRGIAAGTATVTYTSSAGCSATTVVSVLPLPAAVTGNAEICKGFTTSFSQPVTGGVWSSGNAGVASVNASSGAINGVGAGNAVITYTLPSGCIATRTVTVNPLPAAIGGSPIVCEGATTNLTDADAGGTWTTTSIINASVDINTGVLTGVNAGSTTVTYTLPTGCINTATILVNASPLPISGASALCETATMTLTDGTPAGNWTSSNTGVATVNASGTVTGVAAGSATITYALGSGCRSISAITVNQTPATINGATNLCEAGTSTFSTASTGGNWSSGSSFVAGVNASGLVTGAHAGNTVISYTLPTGCSNTKAVTVDPLPADISGTSNICEGSSVSFTDATPNGTWMSTAPAIASVNASGTVTGSQSGPATIVYTLPTGCSVSANVTIDALPAIIGGSPNVCTGQSTLFTNSDMGGTWTSNAPGVASVSIAGNVSGVFAGSAIISYTLPTGCARTKTIVVDPLPGTITGTASVCTGLSTTLGNSVSGGFWTTANSAIADVIITSGSVTGMSAGSTTISYMLPTGCYRTKTVTVNASPSAIGGTPAVCVGATTTLNNAVAGGNWSSSSGTTASINSSGVITGNAAGNANITYTLPVGNCRSITQATVNALPAAITGSGIVCEQAVTALSSTTPNGVWTSNNSAIADVDASGNVTGMSAGNTVISYTLPNTCARIKAINVNAVPADISGDMAVCKGLTSTLGSATAAGIWSSSTLATATISNTGVVSAVAAGNTTISYTLANGCRKTAVITVNPLPADISGTARVCKDATTALTDADLNGSWNSSDIAVAMIDGSGTLMGMSAGSAIITYTLPTGCIKTKIATVNALPADIAGANSLCVGTSAQLNSGTTGGTWSSTAPANVAVNSTGIATGLASGFAQVVYTLPTGCSATKGILVNIQPDAITGTTVVCAGSTTTLSNNTGGGSWSSITGIVSISPAGVVTGIAAGTTIVSYSLGTGCTRTKLVTVNPLPAAIAGAATVCQGVSTAFTNTSAGGTWSSADAMIAAANAATGAIAGMGVGNTTITYTLPTGCVRTKDISVDPSVATIMGTAELCPGNTTSLSNTSASGLWFSGNTDVAIVDMTTGVVTSVAAGTAPVSYVLPTGCMAVRNVVVDPLPAAITGATSLCRNATVALSSADMGGTWASNDTTIAGIDAMGNVAGRLAGSTTITYALPTGCARTATIHVNELPGVGTVSGGGSYCAGGAGRHISLSGSATGTTYRLFNGTSLAATASGTGSDLDLGAQTAAGTYTAIATNSAGCSSSMTGSAEVIITPLVTPAVSITSTAPAVLCSGTPVVYTAHVSNGGATPAYTWSINGAPLGAAGTYTYTPANGDIVTATVVSSATCPSVASVTDEMIMNVIHSETPAVSISAAPGNRVCKNASVSFSATPVFGGSSPSYAWTKGGSPIPGATNATYEYTPSNSDNIACKLTSNYACPVVNNVSSNNIAMTVDEVYIPVVKIFADPGTMIKQGQMVNFTTEVTGAGPEPSYQWLINGIEVSGATSTAFSGSTFRDRDSVTCVVRGTGACAMTSINSVYLTVLNEVATGVAGTSATIADLRLVPNPNNGTFVLNGDLGATDGTANIEVTDMLGQVVYSGAVPVKNGTVNEKVQMSNTLANGMYLLNLRSGSVRSTFHFVVKQ